MEAVLEKEKSTNTQPAGQGLSLVIGKRELMRELSAIRSIVETKTTIPVLANLLLTANSDGTLEISATDLNVSIFATTSATVREPGSVTIPARKLHDYVKLLPDGEVILKEQKNHWIQIKSASKGCLSTTRMVGLPSSMFPSLAKLPSGVIEISATAALQAIRRVMFAISDEESRYVLNGALLKMSSESLTMVSTDGSRLSRMKSPIETSGSINILIPAKALGVIETLLSDCEDKHFNFAETPETLFFHIGNRILGTRKMTGSFPAYEKAIPDYQEKGVMLDIPSVGKALDRCMLMADSRSHAVKLTLTKDMLRLSAMSQDVGMIEEDIDILGGPEEEVVIAFNGAYLKELFGALRGFLEFRYSASDKPGLFIYPDDDGSLFEHVIMPMKVG